MNNRMDLSTAYIRRTLEKFSIILAAVIGLLILLNSVLFGNQVHAGIEESSEVTALSSAMPNQGWGPLQVNFSAFGSYANDTRIVRYEWDLDGNGQYDYDASSQQGYANYLYTKPGEYTIFLRVTDELGRYSTDSVQITVRHPGSSSVDYWTIFDDSRVRRIDISISQTDWDQMWLNPEAKYQSRVDATIFGDTLEDVGFRMRGQFSMRESGQKKPWKIDTDAYIAGQEYFNLRQLVLINNINDPSLIREKLAYEMMAFAGLPASHVAFIELWIDINDNDQGPLYWGVYSLVERVDNKYLSNRFGRGSKGGNLYKASHAQRGPMDLIYYGEDIADYPSVNGHVAYGKMNNEEENDYSDIISLCRVVDGTQYNSDQEMLQAFESVINVDAFIRYMAVITILDNWDSYPNTGNNYYLFNNPVTGRFEWIPWDLAWGENTQAALIPTAGSELIQRAPLLDQVFRVSEYRLRYLAYVDLLLHNWFTEENIVELASVYHQMIVPYLKQTSGDQAFYGEKPMFSPQSIDDAWLALSEFTKKRHLFLSNELKKISIP